MDVKTFISDFNKRYAELHSAYERQFWSSKMALSDADNEKLTSTKTALDLFLGDRETLAQVRKYLQEPGLDDDDIKVLKCFEKTFLCYLVEDPEALALKDEIGRLEAELAQSRNRMSLGYKNSEGEFVTASSVALRNAMRSSEDPVVRLSCYEGMRSIGKFVAGPFAEIVKKRNAFAKKCGYVDFYDMKVTQAEGFSKDTLFGILDGLERDTRPIMQAALAQLASTKGADAIKAENIGFALAGDTTKLKDPYFPFENAVDVWARSFAAMNISYRGSTMQLDLCDRQGKYSNGFCHWPVCAYVDNKTGEFTPAQTNFTSLASPKSVGSGFTAITTLMHEAGHAAHFSNVVQKSPLFSQERAPTSVAYAENQSMFLDSLVSDAAWCSRYALDVNGNPIPFSVLEQEARNTHAYKVLALRAMISVPYFEKKLYELPEDQVTPENIISLADEVEADIQGVLSPRPLLSVPHILADESSCYYHGYVLAEMSVHQTREHFLTKYGRIVDNPQVGNDLRDVYWECGNSLPFLSLVEKLTGKPLSASAWVHELGIPLEKHLEEEKKEYEEGIAAGAKYPVGSDVNLDMRIKLVHGDLVVSDSADGGLRKACEKYREWLHTLP